MKKLFVGNLAFDTTEDALRELFSPLGELQQVKIMTDRDTGKPRGFAFVEMSQDDDAAKAIAALNGKEFGGRALTVNEARPMVKKEFTSTVTNFCPRRRNPRKFSSNPERICS